jgi:hypothetical protein
MQQPLIIDRAHKAIDLILASEIAQKYLSPHTMQSLREQRKSGSAGNVSVMFRDTTEQIDTSCDLYVRFDTIDWTRDLKPREDGSIWRNYKFRVEVNWPSHGDTRPALAKARLEFYTRVVELTEAINAEIGDGIAVCIRTAEEQAAFMAEQERKAEEARIERVLHEAADMVRKGMRVGQDRNIPSSLLPGIKTGVYPVSRDDYNGKVERKYTITVDERRPNTSHLHRVS